MDLSPSPILDAAASYSGEFADLDTGRVVKAAEFHTGCKELAQRLAAHGLRSGERVVVALDNGPHFVATFLAVLTQGGSPLLVHPKAPAPELARTARRFGATLILASDCPAESLQSEASAVTRIEVADWIDFSAARIDPHAPGFQSYGVELPGVPLHPTSGTTGMPKVAVRPGHAAAEEARHYIETMGVTASDCIAAVAPMCHAYAFGMCVMVPLLSGARVLSLRSFQAGRLLQALVERRVTILPAVPAMLDVLMFGAADRLQGAVRTVLTAGSPLAERTARRFHDKSGVMVRPLYGTTETGGITVAPASDEQVAGACVGPPMRGVEAEVRPEANTTDAPPGVGRVHIRSSSMMCGYLGLDGIDSSMIKDGWFATGDLGRIDERGRIHLLGRETDVINLEGLKVIPSEVEEAITALAGVVDVKVYGGQRRNGSQFVKAAVVVENGLDEAAIRKHCESNLVYYKRPERIIPVERLPRSPAGKILRDQLP
ncbi:MAG: class I adenylate-forming enzyme family protein [Pirellulales bacterium]